MNSPLQEFKELRSISEDMEIDFSEITELKVSHSLFAFLIALEMTVLAGNRQRFIRSGLQRGLAIEECRS